MVQPQVSPELARALVHMMRQMRKFMQGKESVSQLVCQHRGHPRARKPLQHPDALHLAHFLNVCEYAAVLSYTSVRLFDLDGTECNPQGTFLRGVVTILLAHGHEIRPVKQSHFEKLKFLFLKRLHPKRGEECLHGGHAIHHLLVLVHTQTIASSTGQSTVIVALEGLLGGHAATREARRTCRVTIAAQNLLQGCCAHILSQSLVAHTASFAEIFDVMSLAEVFPIFAAKFTFCVYCFVAVVALQMAGDETMTVRDNCWL